MKGLWIGVIRMTISRFEAFCERKERAAAAVALSGFRTIGDSSPEMSLKAIGNDWSRRVFDGDFYRSVRLDLELPALSVVFVQSRDGNTVAENPSTLGGGVTDTHLIYEGLSRVEADGVMAGAATARGRETVFSIWHPQLVALRRTFGLPRHPAQIVVTDRGDLPIDESLMFQEPSLRVFVISRSLVAEFLHERIRSRPWVEVIDGGEPLSLTSALAQLFHRGMRNISCVGGPRTATSLLREGLVQDLYLTTSPVRGGEPNTPFYQGPPLDLKRVVAKAGQGSEEGVCFEHFIVDSKGQLE